MAVALLVPENIHPCLKIQLNWILPSPMGMTPILKVSHGVVHQIGSPLYSTNTVMKVTFYAFREVARRELGRT